MRRVSELARNFKTENFLKGFWSLIQAASGRRNFWATLSKDTFLLYGGRVKAAHIASIKCQDIAHYQQLPCTMGLLVFRSTFSPPHPPTTILTIRGEGHWRDMFCALKCPVNESEGVWLLLGVTRMLVYKACVVTMEGEGVGL